VLKINGDHHLQFEKGIRIRKNREKIMKMVMCAINELPPKMPKVFLLSKKEGLDT